MPFRLFFIDKSRIFVSFSTLLLLDEPGRRPAPLRAVPTKPRAAVEVAIVLCFNDCGSTFADPCFAVVVQDIKEYFSAELESSDMVKSIGARADRSGGGWPTMVTVGG